MFNSNSYKDLCNYLVSRYIDKSVAEKVANYVNEACIERSMNFDKVAEEVIKVLDNTPEINYIYNYVKKIVDRLDTNKFGNANVEFVPNTQPFINDLRYKKIVVLADDTVWLNVVWSYISKKVNIDINDCIALNHKIIAYMMKNGTKSFEDYKYYLKNSNALRRYEIDWEKLEKEVGKEITKWNKALDKLEAVE